MGKEIWKLIELLNEYDSWWDYDDYYWPYQYWQDRDAYIYGKYYLVSRDYWFIQWLVQNLKINVDELRKHWYITKTYDLDEPWEWYSYLDWLLMLLSIQDNPIEFLISVLK